MSSLSFNTLPVDTMYCIAGFVPLKDLKSYAAMSENARAAVKDALENCFLSLSTMPLCSNILASVTCTVGENEIKMHQILKRLHACPLSVPYDLPSCELNSIPYIYEDMLMTLDHSLIQFMGSVTVSGTKLIDHGIFSELSQTKVEDTANSLREYFEQHKEEIGKLEGIMEISDVALYTLPPEIRYFHKIFILSASRCCLRSLPEELGEMKSLGCLNVDSNELQTLPSSLKDLKTLSDVDISENYFRILPRNLPKGTSCVLNNNPWEESTEGEWSRNWIVSDND